MIDTTSSSQSSGTERKGNWVEINLKWCKSCSICVEYCPPKALTADEVGTPHLTSPEKCTACGMCEMMCPDFAIEVFKKR